MPVLPLVRTQHRMMSSSSRISLSLFLLFAGVYLLTMRGTHTSVDDIPRYNLTDALLSKGTIQIPPSIMAAATTVDGRVYSKYGIGMSLVMAPLWFAGQGLARIAPEALQGAMEQPRVFAMSTTNQWLGALACSLLFLIVLRIGFRERTALLIALTTGFGSMLWLNSQTSFENVLVVVLIETVVLALIGTGTLMRLATAGAGAAMGFVFLTRWADGWIFAPGAIALLAGRLRRDAGERRHTVAIILAFTVPLLVGIGLAMVYNYIRFYDLFELGYDDDNTSWRFLPVGLFGFLFSPTKSVFVFTPLLILAVAGFGRLWRRLGGRFRAAGLFWMIGAPLVAYSGFETWDGGWCFGPRYLLPSVVLAIVAVGEWIEDERWREKLWRPALFVALLAAGVYAQLICLASNFNDYSDNYSLFRFYPEACPPWACAVGFFRPRENLWFWKLLVSPGIGLGALAALFVPVVFLAAGLVGLRREVAAVRTDAGDRIRQTAPTLAKIALSAVIVIALILLVQRVTPLWRALHVPEGAGLRAAYFGNARWSQPAQIVRTDGWLDFDWSRGRRPFQSDFSVRWEGEIEAPTSGTYFFALDACGTATLALDNRLLIVNRWPQPGRRQIIRSVLLAAGWHPIRLEFASSPVVDFYGLNGAQYARMRHLPTGLTLRWKPPGALFLRTVPTRVLRAK